jgi:hypothetical protein
MTPRKPFEAAHTLGTGCYALKQHYGLVIVC